MRIMDLAIKDLQQLVRNWMTAFFMVIMPIGFTLFFSVIFGGMSGEEDLLRLPVGFMDQDSGSVLSTHLFDLLDVSGAIRPVASDESIERIEKEVSDGDLAAAVIIPAGYSGRILAGEDVALMVIVDSGTAAGSTAQSAIQAAVKGREVVAQEDLEEARDKVRFGRQKKRSRVMSDEDRRMTAYHEAGHALVAKLHEHVEPLHKVTIIPRGISLGMTMVLPEQDKYGMRMKECLGVITMNMAGRVSEEMFCGDVSSGAENDIKAATALARKMVTQWGMSEELGPVRYSDEEQHVFLGNEITKAKQHSEQMAEKIDQEMRAILMECYRDARRACEQHVRELETIAEALLELETLSGEDVDRIFEGATVAELAEERRAEEEPRQAAAEGKAVAEPGGEAAAGGYPRPAGSPA